MTNYLSKYVPGYSEMTAPLRQLLLQDVDWSWQEHHIAAFTKLKLMTSPPVLQYFNAHQPVVLSADASQHGLCSGCLQNNQPVPFASRALTETEARYEHTIEKELLALVYACENFHDYIYARPVTVETDHQPLIPILRKLLHASRR